MQKNHLRLPENPVEVQQEREVWEFENRFSAVAQKVSNPIQTTRPFPANQVICADIQKPDKIAASRPLEFEVRDLMAHGRLTLPSECVSLNRPGFEDYIQPCRRHFHGLPRPPRNFMRRSSLASPPSFARTASG